MEIRYRNKDLERLALDLTYTGGYQPGIVTTYRRRIQTIDAADDERVFYALKSLHFEKLKGQRSHQRSMRLNDQLRLILELEREGARAIVVVVAIEDYH